MVRHSPAGITPEARQQSFERGRVHGSGQLRSADPLRVQRGAPAVRRGVERLCFGIVDVVRQAGRAGQVPAVDHEVPAVEVRQRVADLASRFALSERSLQRLVTQRCGISPKWLIQRRRLHDAVGALKSGHLSLSDLAASLGYSDQAHFTHDFKSVTGLTPGAYLGDQPPH